MNGCDNAKAVQELLIEEDASALIETLDDFFECWVTHERNDCTSAQERGIRFYGYQNLRKMLGRIKR